MAIEDKLGSVDARTSSYVRELWEQGHPISDTKEVVDLAREATLLNHESNKRDYIESQPNRSHDILHEANGFTEAWQKILFNRALADFSANLTILSMPEGDPTLSLLEKARYIEGYGVYVAPAPKNYTNETRLVIHGSNLERVEVDFPDSVSHDDRLKKMGEVADQLGVVVYYDKIPGRTSMSPTDKASGKVTLASRCFSEIIDFANPHNH